VQTVETARVGDRITVSGHKVGEAARSGEIVAVVTGDGRPHYRVRWEDGHESVVYPGSDTAIEHVRRARTKKAS
jgi:hypothetical protein